MKETFVATSNISIDVSAAKVWNALTDPTIIKEWMFGTTVTSDWRVGSSITYKGEWQGKPYEDKGKILELETNKLIKSTYWSGMSGLEDKPENYNIVTYSLSESAGKTAITITQDNNPTKESAAHSESNWAMVLKGLKELLEKTT